MCSNARLTKIPDILPPANTQQLLFKASIQTKYKLDFSRNNVSLLDSQNYFNNTDYIDLNNCGLRNITDSAIISLEKVEKVYFHGNLLTGLPKIVTTLNFSFTNISLYDNPLSCSCDNAWLKTWLLSIYARLDNPKAIQCFSPVRLKGKSIFLVNDKDFCTDPELIAPTYIPLLITATLVPVLLSIIALLVFFFRVKVYMTLGIHPFDCDECDGEEMNFDVFISFAHADSALAREILDFLESPTNRYKVCFHQRDFLPGELIQDNIIQAIYTSKRVLCLLSRDFITSTYCLEEFDISLNRNVVLKRRRIIAMMLNNFTFPADVSEQQASESDDVKLLSDYDSLSRSDDSQPTTRSTLRLSDFVKRHTYIDCNTTTWKQQLLYAMPVKRIGGHKESPIDDDVDLLEY